ncbi:MAG TPA: Minf_1886 family protein [Humisphaera sp.]
MPTKKQVRRERSLEQVVADLGVYPMAAFEFVQQGLAFTVQRIHGEQREGKPSRHVSGQQLCLGLRDFAVAQWGFLARAVLRRWNITATLDFGRIVFAMIDAGLMSRQDEDDIEDFRNVFEFRSAFEAGYRIECAALYG